MQLQRVLFIFPFYPVHLQPIVAVNHPVPIARMCQTDFPIRQPQMATILRFSTMRAVRA